MAYSKSSSRNTSVYDVVTDQIISLLEQGQIPWRKSWSTVPAQNYASKTIYRGINSLLLNSLGFSKPFFLTFRQAKALGGSIRKGAKSFIVTYWLKAYYDSTTRAELTEEEAWLRTSSEVISRCLLRYYRVFHYTDVKGIDFKIAENLPLHLCPKDACWSMAGSFISTCLMQQNSEARCNRLIITRMSRRQFQGAGNIEVLGIPLTETWQMVLSGYRQIIDARPIKLILI